MGANGFTEEENKKLIVLFFKQIGLYREFKEFMDDSAVKGYDKFRFSAHSNPLSVFGNTTITHHLKTKKGYKISDDTYNLYDIFKVWLYAFYPNEYNKALEMHHAYFSESVLKDWIDVEKRCFKKKIIKRE